MNGNAGVIDQLSPPATTLEDSPPEPFLPPAC
jgi:hypothetical protein